MLYSLKVGACLAVFYLFFKLLLSRETFHRLNRIVVLAAMVLSFVLPLCVITVYRELPAMPELPVTEEAGYAPSAEPESQPFPWDKAATAAFLAGAAAALLWTLGSVCGVLHMIRRGHRERLGDGSVLVRTDQPVVPFSWYRYIVMSEKDLAENGEAIVLHEKAHLRLRHSFDLLVTDLAGCLQWFNPAMWLLRRELRAIHEYEADEAVLDSGVDARQYQLLLIRKAAGGRWYSVANSFNHSKLKNRITMMLRKRSSRWAGAKVLFLLPLTGLALGAFARTAYVFPDDKGKKENVSIRIEGANFYSSDGKSGKPLFVVDGLEVASIDTLSPDRIASVTVLKDASAEALYGEKGRNGVVVVSTKDAAGGARDYSVDAEDGSVKVVVRGSGKMSDVRVSGSSTVPADKAGIDAGAKTRGHVVSVTGSDGKKTVVSQSRVTVTDDGGVTVMKTQPDAVQVGGLSAGDPGRGSRAQSRRGRDEGCPCRTGGCPRIYVGRGVEKGTGRTRQGTEGALFGTQAVCRATRSRPRAGGGRAQVYGQRRVERGAEADTGGAGAFGRPPGTGCPGESCRGRVDGSRRRDPSQGRRTYGADRGCRYAEEQYDRDPRIGQVAV